MCDYCSWISQALRKIEADAQERERKASLVPQVDPVIVVHGGAGKIPRYARKFMLKEVKEAAVTAYCDLIKGRSSLDAVERAICHMESKKYFNCAYGGSLDVNEEVVMDAAMMTDGLRAGCVGAVRNIEHPITLAKKVLQQTEHVLIVEEGAQKFALESGIPILPQGQLIDTSNSWTLLEEENDDALDTEETRREDEPCTIEKCTPGCVFEKREQDVSSVIVSTTSRESLETEPSFLQVGAVGAVAYDRRKRLTSGTSTAGKPGKLHGSLSATGTVIGCGIYVNDNGSVSVSGCDKAIYVYAPAQQIALRLRRKAQPNDNAVDAVLKDFEKQSGVSDVGAIAITTKGTPMVSFRCAHFPWACCAKGYVHYGCARNEKFAEKIDEKILERPLNCMCEDSELD